MMESTVPEEHLKEFRPSNPFPEKIVAKAKEELDGFAALLKGFGIRVYRPRKVNWLEVGGFTGSMPRDGLMTVGSHVRRFS
jgi:glycine amidinotransferase